MQIRQGALHLAVPMLYISTKGGAPYRGEGGLHGANHNEVEGNSVTISKDEKFSFWEKMLIDQRNPEPYPYLRKPAETTFYPARKDGWAFYYAFVDMRRYKENHPFSATVRIIREKAFSEDDCRKSKLRPA